MRGGRILWGQIAVVFTIVLVMVWAATQWTAFRLGFQPQLGAPWFELAGLPVHYPPAFFWWWFSFDAYAPAIFVEGGIIAVSGGFLAIAAAIFMSIIRAREARNVATYGSARWAEGKEIHAAGLLGPDGVLLGRYDRDYLRHDGPEHVLCFAPTRSGKGVGLVVPTLLTWPASAIVHDIKGENWTLTAGFRAKHGRVLLFDPTNARSSAYNPLLEVRQGEWEVRVHKISDSASDTSNENIELYILDTISKEFANSTAAAGDSVRVAVFARGTKAAEAIAAGADFVGAEDLLQAIQEMKIDFDLLISTPELMPLVKRIDSILIERGIMPDPRRGTVTNDLTAAIMSAKERIQANSEGTLDELDSLNNNDFSGGFLREKPKSPNITDTENVEKRNNDKPNDSSMFNFEQGQRARKLFAAVVLAALDDAIADDRKYGNGPEQIARWARSRDGREVLSCAGIEPNERVVKGLMEFVSRGVATSEALMANHAAVDVPPVFAALKRA